MAAWDDKLLSGLPTGLPANLCQAIIISEVDGWRPQWAYSVTPGQRVDAKLRMTPDASSAESLEGVSGFLLL